MAYYNTPQPTQTLSVSQPQLQTNFSQANTSFGGDHYAFDSVSNNGFHKQVTSPNQASVPSASVNPVLFGYTVSNVPVIQYSIGVSQTVISPLTNLQSSVSAIVLAPGGTTNLLDFTGLANAICDVYILSDTVSQSNVYNVFWSGSSTSFDILFPIDITNLRVQSSGSIIQIKNVSSGNSYNVYWTMKMLRVT